MSGESDSVISFDREKLSQLFSAYKLPLFFGISGMILFIISIFLNLRNTASSEVVFDTESTASAKFNIRVDVEGSVANPGVYEFMDGERVDDAIRKAGGLIQKADKDWMVKNINRAAKLIDGGKIYIPSLNEKSNQVIKQSSYQAIEQSSNQAKMLGVTTGLVNVNTASQSELEALPGIGPVTAGKIIEGRPYGSLDELKTKKALGNSLYDKLKDKLTI